MLPLAEAICIFVFPIVLRSMVLLLGGDLEANSGTAITEHLAAIMEDRAALAASLQYIEEKLEQFASGRSKRLDSIEEQLTTFTWSARKID